MLKPLGFLFAILVGFTMVPKDADAFHGHPYRGSCGAGYHAAPAYHRAPVTYARSNYTPAVPYRAAYRAPLRYRAPQRYGYGGSLYGAPYRSSFGAPYRSSYPYGLGGYRTGMGYSGYQPGLSIGVGRGLGFGYGRTGLAW